MSAVLDRVLEEAMTPPLQHDAGLLAAIDGACRRIAPLWPLKSFVAVNPFHGFSGQSFHATCATLHRVARIKMLMDRAFYRDAFRHGLIRESDVQRALASVPPHWRAPRSVAELLAALERDPVARAKHPAVVATVAEVLDELASGDRLASRTQFMTDEISKWCAAYFDEGQSVWRLPARKLRPYEAWRDAMRHDLNPEVMGIRQFRKIVSEMPKNPVEAIGEVVARIGVPARATEDYLHQALLDISGWAAYARYILWNSELDGRPDDTLTELLAIRVVWGYALFSQRKDAEFRAAWHRAMEDAAQPPLDEQLGDDPDLCVDMIVHEAYELAYQRRLLGSLSAPATREGEARGGQASLQAAFCIDVRSEIFRRALETVRADAETLGFAGFFGFPIEYVPVGHVFGRSHCPVLLKPAFTVCEAVSGASETADQRIMDLRQLRRRVAKAWKSFKLSAISSFIYVETAGLLFAAKILSDSLALTRTVKDPNTDGMDEDVISRLGPRIEPRMVGGRETGFPPTARLAMAEAVLRAMSMTANFARLVMLAGHGSTTVNNPHASSLDCGACGGNTGEANARVAATILNDPSIRQGLREKGIFIPDTTWFLGCLHDTTTDDIRIFDADRIPATHAAEVAALRVDLRRASHLARAERAGRLGIAEGASVDREVRARSRDWAEVRPEWGLAGNAAFIAAPRARTRGIDLAGRAFLHDYDFREDRDFSTLNLIMTAPMVVASWINLQYYGSTVNNRVFGSGNKVLHNVTGTIGVLEGNAGDLQIGLPWQSVHDGTRFMHEPLRLNVFIAAPEEALSRVIEQHQLVRHLVDHRWLHLFAIDETPGHFRRYLGQGRWAEVEEKDLLFEKRRTPRQEAKVFWFFFSKKNILPSFGQMRHSLPMSIAALPAFLLIPPLNCLAAACLGAVLHRRPAGRFLLGLGLGGLILFAMPLVSGTLLTRLEAGLTFTPPAKDPPAAIVILSGDDVDVLQNGRPTTVIGHLTLEREQAGVLLARRTGMPILVSGGVISTGDPSLAALMAASLQEDFAITPKWLETKSGNTWENAQFSAAILRAAGIHSVFLVTHAWHMRRALMAFRATGILATPAPVALDEPPRLELHNLVPRVSAWQMSFWAMHEWLGCAWYALRG